jgi:hypothetical protein
VRRPRALRQTLGHGEKIRRRLLRAVIGEQHVPGRGEVRRWELAEVAERSGMPLRVTRRGLRELREMNPLPVLAAASRSRHGPAGCRASGSADGGGLWWLLEGRKLAAEAVPLSPKDLVTSSEFRPLS